MIVLPGDWWRLLLIAVAFAVLVTLLALSPRADASVHSVNCRVILHRAVLVDGSENQPAGINRAAPYGWAEVDASVTRDGKVVAIHDARMTRLSGGASREYVSNLTYRQIKSLPHPYGRFRTTARLIRRAARLDTPIMVTINRWATVKRQGYAAQTLDRLYRAARNHPRPRLVYIGGFGAQDAMRAAHPKQATFWRYRAGDDPDWIVRNARSEGIDLVSLPRRLHRRGLVDRLDDLRAVKRVTTRQISSRRQARQAQRAGIKIMQHSNPRRVATKWCR